MFALQTFPFVITFGIISYLRRGVKCFFLTNVFRCQGQKVINHDMLAYKWFYAFMTRPKMRVLRAGGTRLAPTETECRIKWSVCFTISECGAELWEHEVRNNSSGIFQAQYLLIYLFFIYPCSRFEILLYQE